VGEFGFNKKAYAALPADLRRILDLATAAVQVHGFMDYHAKKVHASFTKFQLQLGPWDHVAEGAYHQFVAV